MLRLELLEQHGVTTLWSSLMTAVESASDRWGLADIARRIRAKELYCLAIWKDNKISGSLVLQPTTIEGMSGVNILGLNADGFSIEDWREAISVLCDMLRIAGVKALMAVSENPRVLEIMKADDWHMRTVGSRRI